MIKNIVGFLWVFVLLCIGAGGLYLIVATTYASNGHYSRPENFMLGMVFLYLFSFLTAFSISRNEWCPILLNPIRKFIDKKMDDEMAAKQRNVFLLLTFFVAMSLTTNHVTKMYEILDKSFYLALLINLLVSILASAGLMCWIGFLFTKNQR